MRAVVIGASGHVGSYLVPELVGRGYEVTAISRGSRVPYTADRPEWNEVRTLQADRRELEKDGRFGEFVMSCKPDVVCDLICYTSAQAEEIAGAAVRTEVRHLVQIGSIWAYGRGVYRPYHEHHPRRPMDGYGRGKTEIEQFLCGLTARNRLRCTVIHPGHICGEGWVPINPQGNLDIGVFEAIAAGREVLLPDNGLATLSHVHSADIAGLTLACLDQPALSAGEVFTSVCACGMTLYGYAEEVYRMFGRQPAIRCVPFEQLRTMIDPREADITEDHIRKSLICSMDKARRVLGFVPRYDAMQTIGESLRWLVHNGKICTC